MKILPMEIQRQTFARRMRGFDPEEVRTYLTIVAEEVAALQGERENLAQEAQTLRAMVEDHRQRENILKNTLLTAQRVSEDEAPPGSPIDTHFQQTAIFIGVTSVRRPRRGRPRDTSR